MPRVGPQRPWQGAVSRPQGLKAGGPADGGRGGALGPEGQIKQDHSDSLGLPGPPRGSNTTGFCRAPPWPQPHSEVGLTACFTDSGPWRPVGSCLGGSLWQCPGLRELTEALQPWAAQLASADAKASVRGADLGAPKACRPDSIKGKRSGPGPLGQGWAGGAGGLPGPLSGSVTDGLMEPRPRLTAGLAPGGPTPLVCGRAGPPHSGAKALPGYPAVLPLPGAPPSPG